MADKTVCIAPSRLSEDGRIARGVTFPDGSGRVEVWDGNAWVKSTGPSLVDLAESTKLSPGELKAAGIL